MPNTKYLAIIPARGGSKGLPGKNIRPICGKPLIAWSVATALESPSVGRVVVSTDDEDIARCAREAGAEVPFLRPAHLAEDTTPTEPVLRHVVDELRETGDHVDNVILLQPTSPCRRKGVLEKAIRQFEVAQADSLLSVCRNHHFFWKTPCCHRLYTISRIGQGDRISPNPRCGTGKMVPFTLHEPLYFSK